jgi:hypothetical protein
MTAYSGSCHCGAVSFIFDAEIKDALTCNCSYCRRQGCMLAFGPESALQLTAKTGALGKYNFNKNVIDHFFCIECGIGTHGAGESPNGRMAAVNVRCIPSVELETLPTNHFDGAKL